MSESSKTITWSDPRPSATAALQLSGLEFLKRMAAGEVPPPPIAKLLGFELVEVAVGDAVFEITPDDSHYNPIGVVHGGLALTLLDSAAGCAVHSSLPEGLAYTSLETKVSFLRGITSATGKLRAHGWVTKPGKRAAFAEADLRDAEGTVYATAASTCLVYPVG
ncbi:MAG TPA: PaaI family thioesterase [Aeromicrobium sp.]|nr:PaaI family thioesterase [Aeromicrobium sp.]HKY58657.1 PaaI family thioesterase [Aeromicrobium sp.]